MTHKLGRWLVVAALAALVALLLWPKTSSHVPEQAPAGQTLPQDAASETHAPLHMPSALPTAQTRTHEQSPQKVARSVPAEIESPDISDRDAAFLPQEALDTLRLIADDGPFPYRQDGNVFQNRERRLPIRARGYYREYTVRTPGSRDRGARRIVTGGNPADEFYYTDDHYRSFRRFTPETAGANERMRR